MKPHHSTQLLNMMRRRVAKHTSQICLQSSMKMTAPGPLKAEAKNPSCSLAKGRATWTARNHSDPNKIQVSPCGFKTKTWRNKPLFLWSKSLQSTSFKVSKRKHNKFQIDCVEGAADQPICSSQKVVPRLRSTSPPISTPGVSPQGWQHLP